MERKIFIPLGMSLLFFLRKGIQYAFLGRYVPLIFVTAVIVLLIFSYTKPNRKTLYWTLKVWGMIIMIWSVVRIIISIVNTLFIPLDEYYLNAQFGMKGVIISMLASYIGFNLFSFLKKDLR